MAAPRADAFRRDLAAPRRDFAWRRTLLAAAAFDRHLALIVEQGGFEGGAAWAAPASVLMEAVMKKMFLTAAALTLGTSAYAWMPMQDGGSKMAGVDKAGIEWEADKSATASDWTKTPTVETAKVATDDGDIQIAENEFKAKDSVDGSATALVAAGARVAEEYHAIQMAQSDFNAKDTDGTMTASADTKGVASTAGMGGPYEAATEYPPCRPGPGDDRCIQLYERGVGESLAMAKGAEANVGAGGPFEPVAGEAPKAETSGKHVDAEQSTAPMTGTDHSAHGMPATADDGTAVSGKTPDSGAAPMTPGAIGGPVETRTDYPPCRPGRGDDRCIQLYERGVATRRK